MATGKVQVAVIGTGEVGRGWGAMCVAAGWPTSLFDPDTGVLNEAREDITERAKALAAMERADSIALFAGIDQITVGRSLLDACRDAQWVIEAGPEDLKTKQKMFESIEAVAPSVRAVTSSTSSLRIQDIAARCRQQERCLVAHPLTPPELIPLIEVVPGSQTDLALVEVVKGWLHALGKIPVVIKKPVAGNVSTRIAAAVWREAIDLVLTGVIDVDDLDRAVSLGPALGWAAAGPLLTNHLAAGDRGVSGFLQHLLQTFEMIWDDLPTWTKLEPEQQRKLIHLMEKAYDEQVAVIRPARDRRLAEMLRGMERAKEGS